jgi:hypothetical protein
MNYVLRNPPLVYRHQRAGRSAMYVAGRKSENSRHVRAVVPVHCLVEQLRPYVLQRCSRKNNIIESIIQIILIKTNFVNLNHFLRFLFQFNLIM